MSGQRQPIDLVIARGKKNLTKAEIEARRASEVQPRTEGIEPPRHLTAAQKKHFVKLAGQLQKIKIMGETDCDTLARYVVAEQQYQEATKELRTLMKKAPSEEDCEDPGVYYERLDLWYAAQERAAKLQDRYFKQASTTARDLGLTISSRCKLQVPVKDEPEKPVNKFAKFGEAGSA